MPDETEGQRLKRHMEEAWQRKDPINNIGKGRWRKPNEKRSYGGYLIAPEEETEEPDVPLH